MQVCEQRTRHWLPEDRRPLIQSPPSAVQQPDGPAREPRRMGAPTPDLDEGAEQHPEARGGATGGSHVDGLPRRIQTEEPVKALVRPPPVVVRGGMVDLYPVRRGKDAPTGSGDAVELGHSPARVFTVLEHLRAEDNVEPAAVERYVLDGSDDIGCRSGNNVEADILVCNAREEGKVRLDAAADVQDPDTRTGRP